MTILEKRKFFKTALLSLAPAALASRAFAASTVPDEQIQNRFVAILRAEIERLKRRWVGAINGQQPPKGEVGELLRYTIDTNPSTNRTEGEYDFSITDIPPGNYLVYAKVQSAFFEGHTNRLNPGMYRIDWRLSAVAPGAIDVGRGGQIMPSWGNGTNTYSADLTLVGSVSKSDPWTLYIQSRCLAMGTTELYWFRIDNIPVFLHRIS